MRKYIGTIGETHFSRIEHYFIRQAIGQILPIDNGKKVYDVGNTSYQVENNEQRDVRLKQERIKND